MIPVSIYGHSRSRVRIHARAARANVLATLHIQRWRKTAGLIETQIGTNTHWGNRHNLRVGDHECAFMRAQTCAQHYISSVGAQTAGLIETPIGTNTHWGNRNKLWESACAYMCAALNYGGAFVPRNREAGERARSARVHEWNLAAQPPRARS
jgi:hypothetical protein